MNHGNRLARRCRNHVYLSVPFEFFVRHDHGEVAGARAHIAGLHSDGIGRDHTGPGVSLAGSNGNPRFQFPGRVEIQRAILGQNAGILTRQFDLWQHSKKVKTCAFVELLNHLFIVAEFFGIDREHTARLSDSHHSLSGQDEMDIPGQGSDISDVTDMLFLIQDCLIKVGNRPSLRNIEVKQFAQFFRCFLCNCVSPCTELTELPVVLVKRQIAVHHSRNTDCPGRRQYCVVLFFHIHFELGKTVLKAGSDVFKGICPYAVYETVLPDVVSLRQNFMIFTDQDSLNSCGAEFYADRCFF